jgi:NTE family protein
MRAFVLSGGANYGALQAGAINALVNRGILPDFLVGTSAGALNAAWWALNPTADRLSGLDVLWCEDAPAAYAPINQFLTFLRVARGSNCVISNQPMLQALSRWVSPGQTFGDLAGPRLYIAATRLHDGALRVFGDDPQDRVLDGLMASTALPPLLPPWIVDQTAYVDGGVITNLPLQIAIHRGATEIFALQNHQEPQGALQMNPNEKSSASLGNALVIAGHVAGLMITQQIKTEIQSIRFHPEVRVHLIRLSPRNDPGFWNFSLAREMIETGWSITEHYLQGLPQIEKRRRKHRYPSPQLTWNRIKQP